jgi:cellulose synthase/poly-beta-1,6-N-acetylglucosamine synthase-like glycosyltransferase
VTFVSHVALRSTEVAALVFGAGAAAFALYLAVLALAALTHRNLSVPVIDQPSLRIAVVVPAHNESHLIARCIRSLRCQTYPARLYDVVVVADNCDDATASIAAAEGAQVLVREEPMRRGKGYALRWAMDRLLAAPGIDAIAVVDADTVASPEFLVTLAAPLHRGADVTQGESLLFGDGPPEVALRAAAFLLVNRARPAGRAALGLPCSLAGNGMLLSRAILEAHPWEAFTSTEDLEYALSLRAAGIGPTFASGAVLYSPVAPGGAAAEQQRLRWTGGKLHLAQRWVPKLLLRGLREKRPDLLDAAIDLAVPPLGLLAGLIVLGLAVTSAGAWAGVIATWATAPWAIAALALTGYVLVGLRSAHAPATTYRALLYAPVLIGWALLRTRQLSTFRADTWHRAQRPNEAGL